MARKDEFLRIQRVDSNGKVIGEKLIRFDQLQEIHPVSTQQELNNIANLIEDAQEKVFPAVNEVVSDIVLGNVNNQNNDTRPNKLDTSNKEVTKSKTTSKSSKKNS